MKCFIFNLFYYFWKYDVYTPKCFKVQSVFLRYIRPCGHLLKQSALKIYLKSITTLISLFVFINRF